jgi:hypothetical protein
MFFDVERCRLAARADHDERIGAFLDVPVDQFAERRQVETAVFEHRGDDRGDAAADLNAVLGAVSHETRLIDVPVNVEIVAD